MLSVTYVYGSYTYSPHPVDQNHQQMSSHTGKAGFWLATITSPLLYKNKGLKPLK